MPSDYSSPDTILDPRVPLILRHAQNHFIAEGYVGARMETIARAAGVSTATLYAFFAGKSELFAAVIDEVATEFRAHMSRVKAQDGDAQTQLLQFSEAYAVFMMDPFVQSILRLVMAERVRFPDLADDFFERGRRDFGGLLITAVLRLSGDKTLDIEQATQAVEQLLGMIEHPTFVVPLLGGAARRPDRKPADIAREAVTTLLARHAPELVPQG